MNVTQLLKRVPYIPAWLRHRGDRRLACSPMMDVVTHYGDIRRWIPKDRDIILYDVGAHVGTFCIPLLVEYPRMRALAVEMQDQYYQALERSAEWYGLSLSAVHAAMYGGDTDGLGFYSGEGKMAHLVPANDLLGSQVTWVIPMNQFGLAHSHWMQILKMDIEGTEYEALTPHIIDRFDMLCIELHATDEHPDPFNTDLYRHISTNFTLVYVHGKPKTVELTGIRRQA